MFTLRPVMVHQYITRKPFYLFLWEAEKCA